MHFLQVVDIVSIKFHVKRIVLFYLAESAQLGPTALRPALRWAINGESWTFLKEAARSEEIDIRRIFRWNLHNLLWLVDSKVVD